jgi:hypothetical protein
MPCEGSKLTHQTSPRCITASSFRLYAPANAIRDKPFAPFTHFGIKRRILFNLKGGEIERVFFHGKSVLQKSRHKLATLPGWNGLLETFRKHIGDMKKQLHQSSPFLIAISISREGVNIQLDCNKMEKNHGR